MEDDDYKGACTVLLDGTEVAAEVVLRGYFQPIDGRFHWYGRLSPNAELDELVGTRKVDVILRTEGGHEAVGTVSEPDPWNRYRIMGISRPPFPIETELDATA